MGYLVCLIFQRYENEGPSLIFPFTFKNVFGYYKKLAEIVKQITYEIRLANPYLSKRVIIMEIM